MSIWKNLIILLTSPSKGWSLIGKYNIPKDYLFSKMYGPMLGLLSISAFVIYFYEPEYNLISLLQRCIAQVGVYYFGYMLSAYILLVINNRNSGADFANRIHIFTMYSYALLMLFAIIENLVPPGLIDFFCVLPLYVAFVIWKAKDYIDSDINESKFILIFAISVMLPYFLISFILNTLL